MSTTASSPVTMRLPDIVTLNSETNPFGPFYIYAPTDSAEIVTITHLEFGRATHRVAHLFHPGSECQNGQVIAVLALSDTVLYHAVLVGLMTAHHIPFPMSPRNSPAGIFELLRISSCHRIIATCVTLSPLLAELRKHAARVDPNFTLDIEEMPSLDQVYPNLGADMPTCPFKPYLAEVVRLSIDDISIYLHSSGSTGLPRAIPQTHRALMGWSRLPAVAETRVHTEQPIANMALPSYHLFGLVCQLLQPLSGTCVAVYPPTATSTRSLPITPSPENIIEHAQKTNCRSLSVVPAHLVIWFNSPSAVAYLKTLHTIIWSGGPLPNRIGDALVDAGVHLVTGYGATEVGAISSVKQHAEDEKDWAWFRVSDLVKVRWAPQGDGKFECQILTWENHVPMVENLDDVRGFATADICVNHPQKQHLWRVVGRLDDTIVHTSGEKTVPTPMEDLVMSCPHVAGAVMFGSDRMQTGIVIETAPNIQIDIQNPVQLSDLRNKIWPVIEEANRISPAFSSIYKEMIIFTSPDKPLPRTGKGTVMRKAAISLYAQEIELVYKILEDEVSQIDAVGPPIIWDTLHIQAWLSDLATHVSKSPTISPTSDLLQQGFDSLSATVFRLHVTTALRSSTNAFVARAAQAIPQNLLYRHPTIAQLSTFLETMVGKTLKDVDSENGEEQMENLIRKYACTKGSRQRLSVPPQPAVVLLTGSTGHLGSRLLALLLKDERVKKIYALNRPSAAGAPNLRERHLKMFNEIGLEAQLLDFSKLILLEGQGEQSNLGLSPGQYAEIEDSVTLIIHNAWTVDFNMILAFFEPHILGTRRLIDLAKSSRHAPRFLFTSSVSSAWSWDRSNGPCPENILSDMSVATRGYGQSKYVAEQILDQSGLNVTCIRIGQICGALPLGSWSTSDWVPILVKTSITLGCLPLANGLVSWIDFQTVAQAISDLAFTNLQSSERLPNVLNLVHPRPVSWNFVIRSIRNALLRDTNGSKDVRLIQFADWYNRLEASPARGFTKNLPGLKLLELFRHCADSSGGPPDSEFGGPTFSVIKMQEFSSALRAAKSIRTETVEAWVDYWHASGFV